MWTCTPASWPCPPRQCASWWMRSSPSGGPGHQAGGFPGDRQLEAGPRQVFRDDLGCADLDWERGKALGLRRPWELSGTTPIATSP